MATLMEYFLKDGQSNLTSSSNWPVSENGVKTGEVIARLHYDFTACASYVSFFIPKEVDLPYSAERAIEHIGKLLETPFTELLVQGGTDDDIKDARDLVFTGQVYLYSEQTVHEPLKTRLIALANEVGCHIGFRGRNYMEVRNMKERPLAFISHDSRDKQSIAGPLADRLSSFFCPVWYDEFSLKVGDSLREGIERGLRECPKCVLVLTQNFLGNDGWTKREYDSIFTRELVERNNVILPVWSGVTQKEIYAYSPMLADRVAINWSLGIDEVARRLYRSLST